MNLILFLGILQLTTGVEIVNYSNEPYVLVQLEDAFIYEETNTLFHVINVTEIEEKVQFYDRSLSNGMESEHPKIKYLRRRCRELLDQLTVHREKRSIDWLGKGIKFITGVPDHDDLITIETKLNELIENNARQTSINDKIQKILEQVTNNGMNTLTELFQWVIWELEEIVRTINLAKANILNSAVLNLKEIHQIIKVEGDIRIPLMEVLENSEFKIAFIEGTYILLIKYPKIMEQCEHFSVRAIEITDGKLLLEPLVDKCNGTFVTVENCKKYVSSTICKKGRHTCTEDLINGKPAKCTKIREHTKQLEEIDQGKILIHGRHTVENTAKSGTYLILFKDSTEIDGKNYTNYEQLMMKFLHNNKPHQFEILDILESQNEELRIPSLNMIEKIPIEIQEHPIRTMLKLFLFGITISIIILFAFRGLKLYLEFKRKKSNDKANKYIQTLFESKIRDDLI